MDKLLKRFYSNHVLANLLFALVLVMGAMTYKSLPREQDPSINFNWIQITTVYPGASAEDVEKLVTDKLEEAIRKVSDIKFVSSNSRENVSSILVRFHDLSDVEFDKRINDLRREIQNQESELPSEAESSRIVEITSANAYPSATVVLVGRSNNEVLRKQAKIVQDDLERIEGIDRVNTYGLLKPELQVLFSPEKLNRFNLNPIDLADTISSSFLDVSAGKADVGSNNWIVRWVSKYEDPQYLANIPIINRSEEINLKEVATVQRGREISTELVNHEGQSSVLFSIMKQDKVNTLELVDVIKKYLNDKNQLIEQNGVRLVLIDDQTEVTKNALSVMQTNAVYGLILVLFTTWLFLGSKISFLVSIGIPFILAGTFWILNGLDQTLNVSVLLGVVITLGMLVDDSVVVTEAIYYRLTRGMDKMKAVIEALKEVFAPVTTSVFTTIAVFIPLMMLPGILGKFMMVIPMVVIIALLISLIEAYWMLPAHIGNANLDFRNKGKVQQFRDYAAQWLRFKYSKLLIKTLRYPKAAFFGLIFLFLSAIGIVATGLIHVNFFASDPIRLFYVNIEMPEGGSLHQTFEKTKQLEEKIAKYLGDDEKRATASYSGFMFTETAPMLGDQYGQVVVSLNPIKKNGKTVDEVIAGMREDVLQTPGPSNISFLRLSSGPPTSKPINIKVRADNYNDLRAAVNDLKNYLGEIPDVFDISTDDTLGKQEITLNPDFDAIRRAGLNPAAVARTVKLLVDGEVITSFQHWGEEVDLRLKAEKINYSNIDKLLQHSIILPSGRDIRLEQLLIVDKKPSTSNIRHYNFRRTITIFADIDKENLDTVTANNMVKSFWRERAIDHPNVDLNFAGELDDIEESINAMPILFLFGIGIIYTILGTQFASYWQPFLILFTVPMAFIGVIFGLFISRNPLSLYTLYGIVALSGITVNAAIVLISAANERIKQGMTVEHATIFAAKRRLIPILITSLTTIAGLFSLATGLGGKSLLWGPVATSIVWGLMFSTALTLFFVPVLYRLFMGEYVTSKRADIKARITGKIKEILLNIWEHILLRVKNALDK